jgi:hypothetical protein
MFWGALTVALIAMAHQCEVNSSCLIDTVPDSERLVLQPLIQQLAAPSTTTTMKAKMIFAMGRVFNLSTDTDMCRKAQQFLIHVIESEATHSPTASSVACVALHSACVVLTASTQVCHDLTTDLPQSMMECSMWVAGSAGSLGAYCGGYAISVLLDVADQWTESLWSCGRLHGAAQGVISNCNTATSGDVLTRMLKAVVDGHFHSQVGGARCSELQRVLALVHEAVTAKTNASTDSTASIVMRSLFEMLPEFLQSWATASSPSACTCRGALDVLVMDVCHFAKSEAAHDDATLRALCVCVGSALVLSVQPSEAMPAAVHLFGLCTNVDDHAAASQTSSQTLSNSCLLISIVSMLCPTTFITQESFAVYVNAVSVKKAKLKDFNATGTVLYLALTCCTKARDCFLPSLLPGELSASTSEMLGTWASTIIFADRRTQLYSMMGWHRLLLAASGSGDWGCMLRPLEGCTFKKLRSQHEKHPKSVVPRCSLLQIVMLGLSDLCFTKLFTKLSNFTMNSIFDPVMSPNRQEFVIADELFTGLLTSTSSEGALKIIQYWSAVLPPEAGITALLDGAMKAVS